MKYGRTLINNRWSNRVHLLEEIHNVDARTYCNRYVPKHLIKDKAQQDDLCMLCLKSYKTKKGKDYHVPTIDFVLEMDE